MNVIKLKIKMIIGNFNNLFTEINENFEKEKLEKIFLKNKKQKKGIIYYTNIIHYYQF